MDGTWEVWRGLVVARGNGAVLLASSTEVFNQVTCLAQVPVIAVPMFARGFWGNHHGLTGVQQQLNDPHVGVVSLVGNDYGPFGDFEQRVSAFKVMGLPRRQMKAS